MDSASIIWAMSIIVPVVLSGLGVCIGQGIAGGGMQQGIARQLLGNKQEFGVSILGIAIAETGCILGLILGIFFFLDARQIMPTLEQALGLLGAAFALGIPACTVGAGIGSVTSAAVHAIARLPHTAGRIVTMMLTSAVFIEAPVVLGFIVAIVIRVAALHSTSLMSGVSLCIAGLLFGMSTVGAIIGQSITARAALDGVGHAPEGYRALLTYSLVCAAIIETPVILSLLLTFLIVYVPPSHSCVMLVTMTLGAAACSMILGASGAGIANGWVAARGCAQIAHKNTLYAMVFRITMVTVAIIESAAIYAFIIALLLYTRGITL